MLDFRQIKHFDSIMHWVFYQTSKYENVLLNHGSHGSLKSYMSTTGCQKTKTLNWKSAETEYSKFMHILFQTSGCWKLVDTLWCLRRSMHEFQVWQSQFFRTERSTVHHFWETNHTLFEKRIYTASLWRSHGINSLGDNWIFNRKNLRQKLLTLCMYMLEVLFESTMLISNIQRL